MQSQMSLDIGGGHFSTDTMTRKNFDWAYCGPL